MVSGMSSQPSSFRTTLGSAMLSTRGLSSGPFARSGWQRIRKIDPPDSHAAATNRPSSRCCDDIGRQACTTLRRIRNGLRSGSGIPQGESPPLALASRIGQLLPSLAPRDHTVSGILPWGEDLCLCHCRTDVHRACGHPYARTLATVRCARRLSVPLVGPLTTRNAATGSTTQSLHASSAWQRSRIFRSRSSERVLDALVGVIDAVLVQLLSQASRSAATSSGISSGCNCPIAARTRAISSGDIGPSSSATSVPMRENDLRAIGEVFGRGHFDSTVVDHGTNGGHGCCSFRSWRTRAAKAPNSAQVRASNRAVELVFASGFPSFYQSEFPQVLVDLGPRLLQLGFQPVDLGLTSYAVPDVTLNMG